MTRNYRADFPVLSQEMNGKRLAFLDSGASAQKPVQVIEAMDRVLNTGYSNIHRGLYAISQNLTAEYEAVRQKVADFIGAYSDKEIVFTRNTTDAINLIAQSWGRAHLQRGDEVIISEMEHHANIVPWQLLRDQIGIELKIIPVKDDATLDLDAYKTLLSNKTKLISVVHISNALGTINPVQDIVKIAKDFNAYIKLLIDGSQSIVHMPIDVKALGADFFVFTGHKLYGPTGIGALWGRMDVLETMPPYQGGGDMIEHVSFEKTTYKEPPFRFEAGTPPIVEVIGLGAAIDYVRSVGFEYILEHEKELIAYGQERLSKIEGLNLYSRAPQRAGIFSFTIDGTHPSDVGMILDQSGVCVRTGHHCCMPLMQRFSLDATVRASLGLYNDKDDIDQLIEGLYKVKDLFG
ncbi:MAG: cysteine desulfurase [Micavibrio sp.]|nr:cysteine desulfurase [Micavibrio sp.]|tara:strand:+ start:1955 stop:3172 length:1218 start_codon:yes stop_codon:yes gene_type:complete